MVPERRVRVRTDEPEIYPIPVVTTVQDFVRGGARGGRPYYGSGGGQLRGDLQQSRGSQQFRGAPRGRGYNTYNVGYQSQRGYGVNQRGYGHNGRHSGYGGSWQDGHQHGYDHERLRRGYDRDGHRRGYARDGHHGGYDQDGHGRGSDGQLNPAG